jgi:hypothetical protein
LVGQSPLPLCAKWGTSCLPVPSNQPRLFHLRITNHLVGFGCGFAALCSFAAIARIDQILLAKSGLAHIFPALYAKGDCETQNKESSGETL